MVDEVLAVGDAEFQKKCLGKMKNVSKGGRTVLFVSHNLGAISRLCMKAVVLESGGIQFIGDPGNAVRLYLTKSGSQTMLAGFRGPLKSSLEFLSIKISCDRDRDSQFLSPGSTICVTVLGKCMSPIRSFRTSFALFRDGVRLFTLYDSDEPKDLTPGLFESTFRIPPYFLRPGQYHVSVGGGREGKGAWIWGNNLTHFSVIEEWCSGYEPNSLGLINLRATGERRLIDGDVTVHTNIGSSPTVSP
jgi:lipopolysaccharide transport system ATP-binding protein